MLSNDATKEEIDKIIKKSEEDVSGMRIGRASAMLVENIQVDYYGTRVPLKQMSAITVPDARMIIIEPWAKDTVKNVVAAISASNLGVNPNSDGVTIKLIFPPLSQEEREKVVKLMKQRLEKAKVSIRQLREKNREEIKKMEKNKEISEDEKFRLEKELQKMVDNSMSEIEKTGEEKEKDIMSI